MPARIKQVNGCHHPLLEHPIAALHFAVGGQKLELHVRKAKPWKKMIARSGSGTPAFR